MSGFELTPEELRTLAHSWQQQSATISALPFDHGIGGPAHGASFAGLAACAAAAGRTTHDFSADLTAFGDAVARFADLAAVADDAAAAAITGAAN